MDLLNDISHQIQQSKINWSNISSSIGIDRNDILNIQKKCNPTVEFVYSVTKKIWKDIFDNVGLSLTTNDSYTEVSSILKLGEILAGRCFEENKEKADIQIVKEISQKVSQWKIFGRILGLNESYLNQVEIDFQSCDERNLDIMKKFTSPLELDESWLLWRSYLQQFEDGINVIKEMETTHVELLAETPAENSHIIRKDDQVYICHSYGYEDNKSIQINKQDTIIGVQVGSKDFNCIDYQEFTEWVTTQQRYIDIYDMLKDQKSINFAEGNETFCPILDTIKQYLEITNDPGFVVKGYNYVKHYSLFKKGMFAKENVPDTYFCYIANANVVLYITRSPNGASHALYQSLRNIQIANILHEDLQMDKVVQINVIIHEDNETYATFCKQCIENKLYVSKDVFTDIEQFTSWYDELLMNFKIRNKTEEELSSSSLSSKNVHHISEKFKKDIVTYEALENNIFPSFSSFHEDQIEELKKLVVLSPTQFKALHSKEKHILLRGSYGCGKSVVLLKKLEEVISRKGESDIIYFICNDQQSELIHYMKFIQSKFPGKNILVCNSHDIVPIEELPKLSLILKHILQVWENRLIHVFMDEFNGSYIDEDEVIKLSELLNSFENSFVVIALQSMEEILSNHQKGYQYDLLFSNTLFVYYNLDYSLRCSYEINEFVKSTSKLLELVEVDTFEKSYFVRNGYLVVDKEQGREKDKEVLKSPSKSFYRYNQPDIIGHRVFSGPVNVYYVERDMNLGKENVSFVFLPVLKFILKNASDIKHYVICTYDAELYDIVYAFLKINFNNWTDNINGFLKEEKPFNILLTEYAGVRGYEFQNFIFLLPLGKKFLTFRMIECFARATTELHVIADNTEGKAETLDKQLIKMWRNLEDVKFFDCKYSIMTNTIHLLHGETSIFSEKYFFNDFKYDLKSTGKYRWSNSPEELSSHQYPVCSYDPQEAALLCIMNADDTRLFNEFCTTHNINIYSYEIHIDRSMNRYASKIDRTGMLLTAVEVNAIKITRLLIENHNFDVNSKSKYNGATALHIASRNGNIDIVRLLVEKGADVSTESANYISEISCNFCPMGLIKPIHEAVMHGHVDIIDFLINNNADVFEKDTNGYSLLHFGAFMGQVNVIQHLLNLGLNIEERSHDGLIPLHLTAANGHVDAVRFFIENGVDVDAKDNYGRTCIDFASHEVIAVIKSWKLLENALNH